jgi:hypothetical protein
MRKILTGLALLFVFSSFSAHEAPSVVTPGASNTLLKKIIYSGYFNDGSVTVGVDYNPGLGRIVSVHVSGPGSLSYYVISHSANSTISNSGSTLYASGFYVYYGIVGFPGTYIASWDGALNE